MKKIKLAVLPGDGIGQDVTLSSVPIIEALQLPIELHFGEIGWECWKTSGNPIPPITWELIKSSDATLLGATTSKPEREAQKELPLSLQSSPPPYVSPIVQLRQQLDLYANIRPCFNIKNSGQDFNFCVIRENTEGLYAGLDFYPLTNELVGVINDNPRWKKINSHNAACSLRLQSQNGLSRLFEFAFEYAHRKKINRVTFADKPNVLRKSSAFARDIFERIAEKFTDINADIHNVDAVALWMVKRPNEFGVIVAENMFGDILSDLGAGMMGGLGFAASANIGTEGCYFEPVHGSAPRIKPNCANPSALFLTISLLLEHFGFITEATQIKQAVQSIIKENKYVTYDLGGKASTQTMAKAIIDRCLVPKQKKIISFLATGNEIIQGDIQDTNSNYFAKLINEANGNIFQHMQVSDKKDEICAALRYLLDKSDAVIMTGGLGPTSDDMTRFALADTVGCDLLFDEGAWAHVVSRLNRFNLPATDANRQQALFPLNAKLYPNENGTALGCHFSFQNKSIFMLPGPPKECRPIFENQVLPALMADNFFMKKKKYRWLTLGLIEGEIAPEIDALAKNSFTELFYCWNYPYLRITLLCDEEEDHENVVHAIEKRLSSHLVSRDGLDAFQSLQNTLQNFTRPIYIIDNATEGGFSQKMQHDQLHYQEHNLNGQIVLHFAAENSSSYPEIITLSCNAFVKNNKQYEHTLAVPNRGKEILDYVNSYMAWQINQFIKTYETQ